MDLFDKGAMTLKKTKIICTLGPASRNEDIILKLLKNGMDVARINFSHGTHEYHKETIETFRRVRDKLGVAAAVMLDTKGPEIRIKDFKEKSVVLENGQTFTLTTEDILGDESKVSVTYKDLIKQISVSNSILIDDGRIHLKVKEIKENDIICTVISGGEISNHKGVNIPNVNLDMPYISEVDRRDIEFGIKMGFDFRR